MHKPTGAYLWLSKCVEEDPAVVPVGTTTNEIFI